MVAFIVNPVSGRRGRGGAEGARRAALARGALERHRIEGAVALTERSQHACELSRKFLAAGVDRIIAWGGDGTINEIAGPMIGTNVALGIVPAGSGDGTASSLGLPRDTDRALDLAVAAPAGAIDVGFLGPRHFLNIGGIGFDAAVGRAFNARKKRGGLGYLTGGVSMAFAYRCVPYRVELDDRVFSGERFMVVFANGREYGNHLIIAPDADPRDGLLDVLIVAAGAPLRQFWRARRVLVRQRSPAEGLYRTRVRTATVSGDSLVCHVDGEVFETSGAVQVSISPNGLLVAGLRAHEP
jgi:YegS/Rv2252/BmrU family lipid kinase